METIAVNEAENLLPYFLKYKNLWTTYDKDADVLYMHFKKPNHAEHSDMIGDDTIVRYEQETIIGITFLNASKRMNTS